MSDPSRTNRLAVVDASVAVKWVVVEEFSDRALALHQAGVDLGRPVRAPHLLPNEVTNAIYQRLRRGLISEIEANDAIETFLRFDVELFAARDSPLEAYRFAKAHRLRAIYDAIYVVLAQSLDADLWTDDRRLLAAVGTAAPWVRWIGHYAPIDD